MNPRINDSITDKLTVLESICRKYAMHLREDCLAEFDQLYLRGQLSITAMQHYNKPVTDEIFQHKFTPNNDPAETYNLEFKDLHSLRSKLFDKLSTVQSFHSVICCVINSESKETRLQFFNTLRDITCYEEYRNKIKAPRHGSTDPNKTKGAEFLTKLDAEINSIAYEFAKTELEAKQTFLDNIRRSSGLYILHLFEKKSNEQYILKKRNIIQDLIKQIANQESIPAAENDWTSIEDDTKTANAPSAPPMPEDMRIAELTNAIKETITSEHMKATINAHNQAWYYYFVPSAQSASGDLLKAFNMEIENLDAHLKILTPTVNSNHIHSM